MLLPSWSFSTNVDTVILIHACQKLHLVLTLLLVSSRWRNDKKKRPLGFT